MIFRDAREGELRPLVDEQAPLKRLPAVRFNDLTDLRTFDSRQVANDGVVQFVDVKAARANPLQMLDLLRQYAILDLEAFCR